MDLSPIQSPIDSNGILVRNSKKVCPKVSTILLGGSTITIAGTPELELLLVSLIYSDDPIGVCDPDYSFVIDPEL